MRRYAALAVGVIALAGCGGGDSDDQAEPAAAGGETIEISLTEYKLDPATVTIDEPGTYTFRAVNNGQQTHALEIEGGDLEEETDSLTGGDSAELTVELEAGEYELYCPIGGHKDLGMEGTLSVGGTAGGATNGETETESTGYGY